MLIIILLSILLGLDKFFLRFFFNFVGENFLVDIGIMSINFDNKFFVFNMIFIKLLIFFCILYS